MKPTEKHSRQQLNTAPMKIKFDTVSYLQKSFKRGSRSWRAWPVRSRTFYWRRRKRNRYEHQFRLPELSWRAQMRQAEMELKKGQNMIEHKDEIFSRPARTWFQTTQEKRKAKGGEIITHFTLLLNAAKGVGKLLHINDEKINSSNRVPDNAKVALISCFVPI